MKTQDRTITGKTQYYIINGRLLIDVLDLIGILKQIKSDVVSEIITSLEKANKEAEEKLS